MKHKVPTVADCHELTEWLATPNSDKPPTTSCRRAVKGWSAYADNDRIELTVHTPTRDGALRALYAALLSLSQETKP